MFLDQKQQFIWIGISGQVNVGAVGQSGLISCHQLCNFLVFWVNVSSTAERIMCSCCISDKRSETDSYLCVIVLAEAELVNIRVTAVNAVCSLVWPIRKPEYLFFFKSKLWLKMFKDSWTTESNLSVCQYETKFDVLRVVRVAAVMYVSTVTLCSYMKNKAATMEKPQINERAWRLTTKPAGALHWCIIAIFSCSAVGTVGGLTHCLLFSIKWVM